MIFKAVQMYMCQCDNLIFLMLIFNIYIFSWHCMYICIQGCSGRESLWEINHRLLFHDLCVTLISSDSCDSCLLTFDSHGWLPLWTTPYFHYEPSLLPLWTLGIYWETLWAALLYLILPQNFCMKIYNMTNYCQISIVHLNLFNFTIWDT